MTAYGRSSSGPSAAVRQAYETATAIVVAPVALGVGAICLGYALLHRLSVEGWRGRALAATAAVSAVVSLATFARLRGRPVRAGTAHPWIAALVVVSVMNTALDLALTRDHAATTNFVIVIIGTSVCMVSPRWVAAMVAFSCGGWLAVAVPGQPMSEWLQPAGTVAGGVALAIVVNVSRRQTLTSLVQARECAELASVIDVLTGLYNRRGFALVGAELVRSARRATPMFSVVVVDVDEFKSVNDRYGHEAGDRVLERVGAALASCFRDGDVVSRWGGDEFAVVATGDPLQADELQARLNADLARRTPTEETAPVTVSIGITSALNCSGGFDLDAMFASADREMYERRARARRQAATQIAG